MARMVKFLTEIPVPNLNGLRFSVFRLDRARDRRKDRQADRR